MAVALLALLLQCGCFQSSPELEVIPALQDFEQLDQPVREQLSEKQRELDQVLAEPEVDPIRVGAAYGELGMVHHAYAKLLPARACYRNAQMSDPSAFRWAYLLGHVERGLGDHQASNLAFKKALKLEPKSVNSLIWLAENDFDQNDLDDAAQGFHRGLVLDPSCAMAHNGLARIAVEGGDFERAIEHYEKAVEAQPRASQVLYALALAHRDLGEDAAAQSYFDRLESDKTMQGHMGLVGLTLDDPLLLELDELQRSAIAHEHRGMRAIARQDFSLAVEEFLKAIEIDPARKDAHYNLAIALQRLGRRSESIRELEALLKKYPDFSPAQDVLDQMYVSDLSRGSIF